jgi:lipopolysaccharide exporter
MRPLESESPGKPSVPSLAAAFASGAMWSVMIRWTTRLLGIISLAVCARVLTPADYGLVAMAMVVVSFSNILVEFGIDSALIRSQEPAASLYNSAWSLRIIQGTIIALVVIVAAPIAAFFYKDDRVVPIMMAVGLAGFIGSFQNIYVVNFRKFLDFRTDFIFSVIPRFASFIAAISTVLIFESYWGLVAGICVNELARTVISYLISKQRASWSLQDWRELTHFSGWYLFRGLGEFFSFEFDRFIIGMLGGASQTGLYSVAREVSALPATEIVLPIGRALLPTLSSVQHDRTRFLATIEKAITGTMVVAAPATLGFALIANEFVLTLFGSKWISAAPLVAIFCATGAISGFRDVVANIFVVTGHIRSSALLSWLQAGIVLSLFYPAFSYAGVTGVAWLFVANGFFMSAMYALRLCQFKLVAGSSLWIGIARPAVSSIVMFVVVHYVFVLITGYPTILVLVGKIILGAIVYTLTLVTLWLMMGRPDSSEKLMMDLATSKFHAIVDRLKHART